ncbi:hypothetical protein [Bacillus sp. Marseille-Q1617]|uniref:hypothetical protein n=1 Tax=Bacillus sp. Marseille-Q1617 TaxID=2736887 RepID=UPI00158EC4F2|nr:hypothetical protein [Bacillus sp. Marseille-Q1617]
MNAIQDFCKDLFLDVLAAIKGFLYGFIVIGLTIGMVGVLIYLFFYMKNVILS